MKLNRLLLCYVLSILGSVALYSIDYREVPIVLPQEILRDLQNYKQVRFLYWVSTKEILFGEHMDSYWVAKIVDIEKGIVTHHLRFDRSEHVIRIDGQRKWILTRGLKGDIKTYSYNTEYYAEQGLYSERFRIEHNFIARGQSQYRINVVTSDGSIQTGDWNLVADIVPFDSRTRTALRVNGLPHASEIVYNNFTSILIFKAGNYQYYSKVTDMSLSEIGIFPGYLHPYTFIAYCDYLITLELLPGTGYLWGTDGPSPLYPRVLDFEGNVISEFKDIIIPEGGKPIDYNGDTGQFVTLEISDNRTMAATLRVYELLGVDK